MFHKDKVRHTNFHLGGVPGALDIAAYIITQPLDSELNPCSRNLCKSQIYLYNHRWYVPVDEWMNVWNNRNLCYWKQIWRKRIMSSPTLFNAVLFIWDKKTKTEGEFQMALQIINTISIFPSYKAKISLGVRSNKRSISIFWKVM